MTARWAEALDTQLDAWRWYRETGEKELRGFAESFLTKMVDPKQEGFSPDELSKVVEQEFSPNGAAGSYLKMIENIPNMLWNADPVYVDSEMMPLVHAALAGWKAEPLLDTDMLIRDGFLLLPEPVWTIDIHGKRMGVRGFLWAASMLLDPNTNEEKPGIALALFSDSRDPDDYPMPSHYKRGTTLALYHVLPWAFGDDATNLSDFYGGQTGVETLQCILRLIAQTIAARNDAHAPRETRKRLERARFPARRITVVTLRRPDTEKEPGEHHTVEWSRRWLVGGHWRNQWYPSISMHRQIWISPYVKGPTDLPLVVPKAHVYQFVR